MEWRKDYLGTYTTYHGKFSLKYRTPVIGMLLLNLTAEYLSY